MTMKKIHLFNLLLNEIQEDIYPGDMTLKNVLGNKTVDQFVNTMVKESKFGDKTKAEQFFMNESAMANDGDVLLKAGDVMMSKLNEANTLFGSTSAKDRHWKQNCQSNFQNIWRPTSS